MIHQLSSYRIAKLFFVLREKQITILPPYIAKLDHIRVIMEITCNRLGFDNSNRRANRLTIVSFFFVNEGTFELESND